MASTPARVIYPELPDLLTPSDLQQLFSPSFDERQREPTVARIVESQVALLVQLKIFQTIGRFRPSTDIPPAAINHLARRMGMESGLELTFPTERCIGIVRQFSNALKWFRGALRHASWPKPRCLRLSEPERIP